MSPEHPEDIAAFPRGDACQSRPGPPRKATTLRRVQARILPFEGEEEFDLADAALDRLGDVHRRMDTLGAMA